MRRVALIAASLGALVLTGAAGEASAQSSLLSRIRMPAVSVAEAEAAQRNNLQTAPAPVQPGQRRALRFNESGRWGLNLNLNQPIGREADWSDVEAGAYYRVNPRLHVGAAAGLATPEPDPARIPETDRRTQSRVRLETIFKF